MVYHFTPIRACQKLKYDNINFWQGHGISENMLFWVCKLVQAHWRSTGQYFIKS